ncbi:MAG TPA: class F sortase [Jatrophihabitantaceae bacterium]|jgi:hypothetical protein
MNRPPWLPRVVVAAPFVGGAVAVVLSLAGGQPDRHPPRMADPPSAYAQPVLTRPLARSTNLLSASMPTRLDIAAIGVHSPLLQLGVNPDGTVQVPPLAKDSRAGWYRYSPTPGQLGPAVILGHVDSAKYGPGVFYRLHDLRPGDIVDVTRADSSRARFRVARVAEYPKARFPTDEVYGNVDHAALRLITCGGDFDRSSGNYLDNVVVFADLV